ncbi:TadE/TadG family type IV pilus assembly protein [Propionicicella superfundia]|uniref:TadE/TadG family type IV pilus assembly protein n=1 Tax=Propionicicella superfundia TaxID=348582 RepID=UPI0003FB9836|nr:TadE/TadG family type IV pilus assembly protein [Propionicicella superfundia]
MTRPERRDERGLADSTAWALLMPLLLALILGLLAVGLWMYARMGAATAAAVAGDTAAAATGDPDEARRKAIRIAENAGVREIDVSISRADGLVTVTVRGNAVLPVEVGGLGRIHEQATRPVEAATRP